MAAAGVVMAFLLAATMFASSPLTMADKDFDFFFLINQWPGAICSLPNGCCEPTTGPPAKDFGIRAFVTYDDTIGEPLRRCTTTSFDINQVNDVREELQKHWSNIRCPSNDGVFFWNTAWKTYGVCSEMTQSEYFTAALNIRSKANLLSVLEKTEIVPGSELYKVEDIKSAIAEGIGATPVIRCAKSPDRDDVMQLLEVYICVSKDGTQIIECPVYQYFSCSSEVQFRPFDHADLKNATSLARANPIKMSVE